MRQRPVACLALLVFLILTLLPAELFYEALQVTEKCEVRITGRVSRQVQKDEKTQIYLQACRVWNEKLQFKTDKLLIYLSGSADYPVGTSLSLSGTIYPIEEPTNPGQFNSRLYYQGKGIAYSVYAESADAVGRDPAPIREKLLQIRQKIGQVYERALNERDSSLLRAMILGEKEGLDADIRELYQRNGISHLLAISGLHISLVGMGLYRILRRLTGCYAAAGISSALFLCAYGWMTGASVSAVRAAVMCSLAILADWIGRTYDMLTAIGASALALMAAEPLCVRQSAFLLSFGAALAIALIQPLWSLYRKKMKAIAEQLSVSISVLMVTFPLLLRFFFQYPVYSTFLNLLAIPLMGTLMVCGLLCGFVGLFIFPAARIFAVPCHLILSLYEWAGKQCLSLPGAVLTIGSPGKWKVLSYYGILLVVILLLYREKRRKKYWRGRGPFCPGRGVSAGCAALLAAGALLLCIRIHTGLDITMLDVGQGDSIFFRSPSGMTFLYDGGSTSVKKAGNYRILPFLQSEGEGMLDYMIISHMDADHINGLRELIEDSQSAGGIRIGHAVLPALAVKDEAYTEMEKLLGEAKIPILYMGSRDRLSEQDFSLTCLWPEREDMSDDRNGLSLVLMAEYGDFRMLLTGDIGEETEGRLLDLGLLEEAEILKAAHHGSRRSSSEEFLEKVRPLVSLISCSASNRYGHPGKETLQRLSDTGSRIRITKDCGAVMVWTDGSLVRVKGFSEKEQ